MLDGRLRSWPDRVLPGLAALGGMAAPANLVVFVFVMTGMVYATQRGGNPAIQTPVDALYFTVTSLTTTGYRDITVPGRADGRSRSSS